MAILLSNVPRRLSGGARSALEGLDYFELVEVYRPMAAQDPSFVFGSLRPLGDEFWNLIDGERSFGEIAEMLLYQFGFELDLELFLPLAEGLLRAGHIEVASAAAAATDPSGERA